MGKVWGTLHQDVWNDDVERVRLLLSLGQHQLNVRDRCGRTPLHCAATVGSVQIVRELLRAGYDPSWRADVYIDEDSDVIVSVDAEQDEELNSGDGPNALHLAAAFFHIEAIEAILESRRVHIDEHGYVEGFWGPALLHALLGNDDPCAAMTLLNAGADAKSEDDNDRNILHFCAARRGDEFLALMRQAIECGADVNQQSEKALIDFIDTGIRVKGTPLTFSIQSGFHEAVVLLVKSGAWLTPAAVDFDGCDFPDWLLPPLMLAPFGRNLDTFHFLISSGCDVTETTESGCTFLHYCVTMDTEDVSTVREMMRWAVDLGVDVRRANDEGDQAIHKAADRSKAWLIPLLVELGADINARGRQGRTPLTRARLRPTQQAILDAGADALARDDAGQTALSVASQAYAGLIEQGAHAAAIHLGMSLMTALVAAGDRQWDLVPSPCRGLEAALPAVVEAAPNELHELFQRLEPAARAFIRTTLLTLHRVLPKCPHPRKMAILCAALAGDGA